MFNSDTFLTHFSMIAGIVTPLGSGIIYLIYRQGQDRTKIDTMWAWYTNHGSDITGYKPGDEKQK